MEARFDDLGPVGSAFRFAGPSGEVVARTPGEILPALLEVERACEGGLWAAGFLAYEAAPGLDPDLRVMARDGSHPFALMPLAWFGLWNRREEVAPLSPPNASYTVSRWIPSVDRSTYEGAVERIRSYIAAGDTYQVNHTIRLHARFLGTDRALHTALCLSQRAPHCAYLDIGRYRILSASPELFFELQDDGTLVTRPMKGTAPRGRSVEEDEERAAELIGSAKERAENAMIVDLLRNDMGRISRPGSVRVTSLFDIERYETVWQLTSTVSSELREGVNLAGIFAALFPSGSVTGAPKVRSMEVISELEDSPRGVYTGSIGWVAPPLAGGPRARFNVAIRTVLLDGETGTSEYGVGGGITYDSTPAREYAECLTKARVLTERRPEFRLIESLLLEDGELLWLGRHLARLSGSAGYFGFAYDDAAVRETLRRAAEEWASEGAPKVRLELARDGTMTAGTEILGPADPVRVAVDDRPVDASDPFLFHKTTLRRVYEEASCRHPEADDVLLVNDRSEITEATSSNVIAKIGGRWLTPPLSSGLLPGVHRAVLIRSGEVEEKPITTEELHSAEEIVLVNSVRLRRSATLL